MPRRALSCHVFVLVLVQHEGRFLVVRETDDGSYYLPAGGLEGGESVPEAAMRETMEEAGIDVRVTDLVAVEHTWSGDVLRLRYVVRATPRGDLRPKSFADEHSLGAAWLTREELATKTLRHREVLDWTAVPKGAPARLVGSVDGTG